MRAIGEIVKKTFVMYNAEYEQGFGNRHTNEREYHTYFEVVGHQVDAWGRQQEVLKAIDYRGE